ncbi:BURP domain protein RD22-like [Nicotiana tabacum]|uniref:BURP domain protein RD22-like n=1 Tax=Nicotiana tabacum TaxID=4097 RepID=A0AC58TX91_TOBAC
MVDFSTSKLGNKVQPVSTETEKETQMQKYTILGAKKMKNGKSDAAKAVVVCHKNISAWNPKHLAFKLLKVTPGFVSVCHFLPEDHIVWVPKN